MPAKAYGAEPSRQQRVIFEDNGYHSSDAAIRGHVFCSFLALVLRKELDQRCRAAGVRPEWGDVVRDLDRLQEVTLSKDGQSMTLRTPATGVVGPLFEAARVALPPNIRDEAASPT